MERALEQYSVRRESSEYHYDGKTDRQIVREQMRLEGLTRSHRRAQWTSFWSLYRWSQNRARVGQRVRFTYSSACASLLDGLEQRATVTLGLLTGNVIEGARAKLGAAGMDISRFKVNAFGSDHEHRPELPGVAQRRAKEILGHDIAGDRVVVIGDTPADVDAVRQSVRGQLASPPAGIR